ncbi:hypothetical protein Patl1_36541 [Pistacia atlantica]|nr:hypothetical protein Patl1_36541 [Pistacia atlantica]
MLKSKINKNDPNATKTLNQINAIQKVCMNSGVVNRRLVEKITVIFTLNRIFLCSSL